MTRSAAARALGVSNTAVRKMEGETLHPVVENGVHTFDTDEVQRVAADRERRAAAGELRDRGAVAARVFARLDAGEELSAIVVAERLDPRVVRDLAREWRALKAEDLSGPSVPSELAEIQRQLDEDRAWQEQMVAAFTQLNEVVNQIAARTNRPGPRSAGRAPARVWRAPR
jgi:hypothetical protein